MIGAWTSCLSCGRTRVEVRPACSQSRTTADDFPINEGEDLLQVVRSKGFSSDSWSLRSQDYKTGWNETVVVSICHVLRVMMNIRLIAYLTAEAHFRTELTSGPTATERRAYILSLFLDHTMVCFGRQRCLSVCHGQAWWSTLGENECSLRSLFTLQTSIRVPAGSVRL